MNELNASVTSWKYDEATGTLSDPEMLTTLLPHQTATDTGTKSAAIMLTPDDKYVFVTNRSEAVPSSVACFNVADTGRLVQNGHYAEGLSTPRAACLDALGHFMLVANQTTDSISVLKVNPEDGTLSLVETRVIPDARPTCVQMMSV